MAGGRPIKRVVDYFPHDTKHGQTLFILEQKFGNDGYTFWFKLLEILGRTDGHFYDCNNPPAWEYLIAYTHLDATTVQNILDTLALLGKIDQELWKCNVLWYQRLVDRLTDVYARRKVPLPTRPEPASFRVNTNINSDESDRPPVNVSIKSDESDRNHQRKGKERKGKERASSNEEEGAKAPDPLLAQTPASKLLFEKLGAKRWKNMQQKESFEAKESQVGVEVMKKAIVWFLNQGRGLSQLQGLLTCADTIAKGDVKHGRDLESRPDTHKQVNAPGNDAWSKFKESDS